MNTNSTSSILSASTSKELVDAMNSASSAGMSDDEILTVVKKSELFDQELMNNLEFLYDEELDLVVLSSKNQHSFPVYIFHAEDSWETEPVEASKPVVSMAMQFLDDASSTDLSQWSNAAEFLQYVYGYTTYWVCRNVYYASGVAENILSNTLKKNGFKLSMGPGRIESEMTASFNGEKFILNAGFVETKN